MTIKEDWINLENNTTVKDDLKELKEKLLEELGLTDDKRGHKLVRVSQEHHKIIRVDSLFRIPLKHLCFIEDEGFWFSNFHIGYVATPEYHHGHHHYHGFRYHYEFIREDYIKEDRRFYEENYPVKTEEDGVVEDATSPTTSSSLGATI